jgi:diguanylate cyclase (GGDEF)-like protein
MPANATLLVAIVLAIAAIVALYLRLWHQLAQHSHTPEKKTDSQPQPGNPPSRHERYLEPLNKVAKLAVSGQDAETILNQILVELEKGFALDHLDLRIVDDITQALVVRAETGRGSAIGKRCPLGSGLAARVARSREPALVEKTDLSEYPLANPDTHSALCVPLTYQDTLLGILNLETGSEDGFLPETVLALQTAAGFLSIILYGAATLRSLQQQSVTDALTGLKTRRYFLEALQTECKRAGRSGQPFSLIMAGVDGLTDSLDRQQNDLMLARVGQLLTQRCRQSNVVAHYEEDEFILLIPDATLEQAQTLAERLRFWLEADPVLKLRRLTGSFGVASYTSGASGGAQELLHRAQTGMYLSKQAGGNRVTTPERA